MALAQLGLDSAQADVAIDGAEPLAVRPPHFTPKAKQVIFLHMAGSPPHLDLLDYKPELVKRDGEDCPAELFEGRRFAFTKGRPTLLGTRRKFTQVGQSGAWMSDAIPRSARSRRRDVRSSIR